MIFSWNIEDFSVFAAHLLNDASLPELILPKSFSCLLPTSVNHILANNKLQEEVLSRALWRLKMP